MIGVTGMAQSSSVLLLCRSGHRSFKPAGKGERLTNDGHENGHQHSNTTRNTPTCAGTERPAIANELTSSGTLEDRTKRGKENFKTGALNHPATLPSPRDQLLSSTLDRTKVNVCHSIATQSGSSYRDKMVVQFLDARRGDRRRRTTITRS